MYIHTGNHYFCPISMNTNINSLYFAYESADWRQYVNLNNYMNYNSSVFTGFNTNQSGWTYAYGNSTPAVDNNYGWSYAYGNSSPVVNNNYGWSYAYGSPSPVVNNNYGWSYAYGNPSPVVNNNYGWSYAYGNSSPAVTNNYGWSYAYGNTSPTVNTNNSGIYTNEQPATSVNKSSSPQSTAAVPVSSPSKNTQAQPAAATSAKSAVVTPSTQTSGSQGAGSSNEDKKFAKSIAQNAENYIGYNENDGSYRKFSNSKEWCADFVTYVVKESYAKQGKVPPAGFGSWRCENLKQWAINNNKFLQTAGKLNKAQLISQYVKPGDILILRENGASHTGIVKAVNTKTGAFSTIEGNVEVKNGSDCVTTNTYSPYDKEISGFIQLV